MGGMIGPGDAAIGPDDLPAGHVRIDQGFIHRAFNVARGGLDSDAKVIGWTGDSIAQRAAGIVRDEGCRFRRAAVDAEVIRHAEESFTASAVPDALATSSLGPTLAASSGEGDVMRSSRPVT